MNQHDRSEEPSGVAKARRDASTIEVFVEVPMGSRNKYEWNFERQALEPALAHFFNHQTHHRGQAHTVLCTLGHRGLVLDLLYFQREVVAAQR